MLGSRTDEQVMQGCIEVLTKFGVDHELRILSAHRNPEEVAAYVKEAEGAGIRRVEKTWKFATAQRTVRIAHSPACWRPYGYIHALPT